MKNKKIMVIAAHPDDEILGCGGTIAMHIKKGHDVYIIILSDGVTSRKFHPSVSRQKELKMYGNLVNRRKREFFNAMEIMGVKIKNCFLLNHPDQRLDTIPLLTTVKKIEELSNAIRPDIVYTHHWGDVNKDHRLCFEAALTSFRPKRQVKMKTSLFCFSIIGNMSVLPPFKLNKFRPTHFVPIKPYFSQKFKALSAYKSEFSKLSTLNQLKKDKFFVQQEAFEPIQLRGE